jgi:hypothetical protein
LERTFDVAGANEVSRRRGAKIPSDFVVAHPAGHLQAQLGLQAKIGGVLHGRFSTSALLQIERPDEQAAAQCPHGLVEQGFVVGGAV